MAFAEFGEGHSDGVPNLQFNDVLNLGKCSMFFKEVLLSQEMLNVEWRGLMLNQKCASFWGNVE
eukprot:3097847-Amphidinium_carterae.1